MYYLFIKIFHTTVDHNDLIIAFFYRKGIITGNREIESLKTYSFEGLKEQYLLIYNQKSKLSISRAIQDVRSFGLGFHNVVQRYPEGT